MEENGYERQISLGRMVARGFEEFWMKNQLGVDRKGRVYRTNVARNRPVFDMIDFRNPKRKGKKNG